MDCTIAGNKALAGDVGFTPYQDQWHMIFGLGGGLYNGEEALAILAGCVLTNNEASRGGGAQNYGLLFMTGGLVVGNIAKHNEFSGGGLSNENYAAIEGVLIKDNTAPNAGSGVIGRNVYNGDALYYVLPAPLVTPSRPKQIMYC